MLQITCHGGVGEIGGNKILLEDGGSALMLDFGKRMGAVNAYFDEFLQPRANSCLRDLLSLGLLPEIPGIYRHDLLNHAGAWDHLAGDLPGHARRLFSSDLESYDDYTPNHGPRLDGIVLSHAHADHAQDLCFVDRRIPVYCSHETLAILKAAEDVGRGGVESEICRCATRGLSVLKAGFFPNELKIETDRANGDRDIRIIEPNARFQVGGFEVEAIPVDHSVPGACAYLIKSPSGKVVFYTGDLRFQGRLNDLTTRLRKRVSGLGPDVFITEGTRICDKQGRITTAGDNEDDVERKIADIVRDCKGLAVVDFGWKDTTRFQTILEVARATGRVLAVSPKVAYLWALLDRIDPAAFPDLLGAENLKVYLERSTSMTYSLGDYSRSKHAAGVCTDWDGMKDAFRNDDKEYLQPRLCHYFDGVRAYHLAADPTKYILHAGFFDMNELFDISPPAGSVYISAMTEPFCDEMALDQEKLKHWLDRFSIDYGGEKIEHHHVSGHANGRDLLDLIKSAEPKLVIPVHTEHAEVFGHKVGNRCRVPVLGEPIPVG